MDEENSQKCVVVAWNQLQFTSVSSERIEELFREPKVVMDEENGHKCVIRTRPSSRESPQFFYRAKRSFQRPIVT